MWYNLCRLWTFSNFLFSSSDFYPFFLSSTLLCSFAASNHVISNLWSRENRWPVLWLWSQVWWERGKPNNCCGRRLGLGETSSDKKCMCKAVIKQVSKTVFPLRDSLFLFAMYISMYCQGSHISKQLSLWISIHLFVHSLNKYISSTYCMLVTVLTPGNTTQTYTKQKYLYQWSFYSSARSRKQIYQ